MAKTNLENTPFFKNLTANNSSIKSTRASLVAKQVEGVLTTKLQQLRNQSTAIELSISQHEDLGATNTQSLVVASKDFDAESWINKYYELLEEQRLLNIDLAIYEDIERRQFSVEATETQE